MHVEAPIGFVNILFFSFFLRYLISFKQKLDLNKIRVYNRNCRRLGISQLSKKTNYNKYTKGKRGNLRLILQLPVTDDGKGVAILIF